MCWAALCCLVAMYSFGSGVGAFAAAGLVLLVAGVAQRLQVSAAVGAFLVGIALSGEVADRARRQPMGALDCHVVLSGPVADHPIEVGQHRVNRRHDPSITCSSCTLKRLPGSVHTSSTVNPAAPASLAKPGSVYL